jgi:uncharacterized membrane protein YqiK
MITRWYRKVDQGKALIVNTMKAEPIVTFTGAVVLPVVHRAEVMDISVKTIEIDRRGKEGLICQDNIRADIKVTFFVRVNKTREDVLKVAQSIGCVRASDQSTLEELFSAKFSEALKTVGKRLDFEQLYTMRDDFRDQIIEVIGRDLNGYVLDDAAIDFLEQTPMASLDKDNILDAQGIRKITQITAEQAVDTNELRQKERMEIASQDVQADEAIFRFEQERADAEAKKEKEIAIAQARESNEALRVEDEENKKTELLKRANEAEVLKAEENKLREAAVAEKGKEREIAVEEERVVKARSLEAILREREVELQRIEKEKALEVERKAIADIIRTRVAVDKTVAEEEEQIKDLRVLADAKRTRDATVIAAEAEGEEDKVKKVKSAEAEEEMARSEAKKMLTLAEAELQEADKQAAAKIRLAEGVQASEAATGLAAARVKEADAVATEKLGLAEVRVKEANAAAIEKEGMAEVTVSRERYEVDATGTRQMGLAEGVAIKEKMTSEAAGLTDKAEAMKALDEASRDHEEYRLRLEKDKEIDLAQITARREIAEEQAKVLAEAMGTAKINIVGGDGAFFERFIKAVSLGYAADGTIDSSERLQGLFQEYLDGTKSLPADVKEVLSRPAVDADAVSKLTVSAVLAKLMLGTDDQDLREKLNALAEKARELGIE